MKRTNVITYSHSCYTIRSLIGIRSLFLMSHLVSFLFLQVKFRVSDVQVPDIPGMFTTFKANNVPLFVDGQQVYTNTCFVIPTQKDFAMVVSVKSFFKFDFLLGSICLSLYGVWSVSRRLWSLLNLRQFSTNHPDLNQSISDVEQWNNHL